MIDQSVGTPVAERARSADHHRDSDRWTGLVLGAALVAMALVADLAHVRDRFEGPWVAANIVRTLLSTAAVAALARALFLFGRNAAGGWRPGHLDG